jgi:hypothetical protein
MSNERRTAERPRRVGNPNIAVAQQAAQRAVRERADKYARSVYPLVEAARADGEWSLGGIARHLNALGIPAPRGGTWTATQVRNLIRRIEK